MIIWLTITMLSDFQTVTYGKWILAGEHTVLRGGPALVFPVKHRTLELSFQSSDQPIAVHYLGESASNCELLFWGVLEKGARLLCKSLDSFKGRFQLNCNIPFGVGMGASAALCVAISRWFSYLKVLPSQDIYDFAKELEHLFHGKSSGVDIAGVSVEQGVCFQNDRSEPLAKTWSPHWYLSTCDQIGMTSHCIQRVQSMIDEMPERTQQIDSNMIASVEQAKEALTLPYTQGSLTQLAEAIMSAGQCFKDWGLVSEGLQHHIDQLRGKGALAVKPTGSGGGGFVLSLWPSVTTLTGPLSLSPA